MARKTEQHAPPENGEDLLQQAKQTTTEVVGQVQQQAGSKIDRQKDMVAGELEQVAGAVRQLGQRLSQQEQGPLAHYAASYGTKAAEGIEWVTNYLRQKDTKALVNDLERLGRRQPVLLVGAGFLLGLAGARFLKSAMPAAEADTNTNLSRGLPPPPQPQPHVQTKSATL